MISKFAALVALAAGIAFSPAQARVTISSNPTQNMSCSGGVCAPTGSAAVLNVDDLEALLASGSVTVTTTGTGIQAKSIYVTAPLSWTTQNTLTLNAFRSIQVEKPISVEGEGSLSFFTSKPGILSFGRAGHVTFASLLSTFSMNGGDYALADSISMLAKDIRADPKGNYALANSYDAAGDGTYKSPPISNVFRGNFEGLGNTISHLSISDASSPWVGLFAQTKHGVLSDLGVINANVKSTATSGAMVGILAGFAIGNIRNVYSTGKVAGGDNAFVGGLIGAYETEVHYGHRAIPRLFHSHSGAAVVVGQAWDAGGLVGDNVGIIEDSYATGPVKGGDDVFAGGLVGFNGGTINQSFATGTVTIGNMKDVYPPASAGGLVGYDYGATGGAPVMNSYATGSVSGGQNVNVGGLLGIILYGTTIESSYSTGSVTGGSGSFMGGLLGYDDYSLGSNTLQSTYWDIDTSGITNLSQGAGNIANDPGITGETTKQLQSGLPAGFDPSVWAEDSNINGGLPYLINNPPPK